MIGFMMIKKEQSDTSHRMRRRARPRRLSMDFDRVQNDASRLEVHYNYFQFSPYYSNSRTSLNLFQTPNRVGVF